MAIREINLVPDDILKKKSLFRRLFFWSSCLTLSLFLIFGFYLYQVHVVLSKKRPGTTLEDMQRRLGTTIEEINKTQQEIQRLSLQESFVKNLTRIQPFSRILMKLSEIMNVRTWLTKLIITSNTEKDLVPVIELYGNTLTNDDLGSFLTQLSVELMFNKVVLKYSKETQMAKSSKDSKALIKIIQFQIDCEIPRSLQ
jgi:arsenate reductase-like glutaredoxin family protein